MLTKVSGRSSPATQQAPLVLNTKSDATVRGGWADSPELTIRGRWQLWPSCGPGSWLGRFNRHRRPGQPPSACDKTSLRTPRRCGTASSEPGLNTGGFASQPQAERTRGPDRGQSRSKRRGRVRSRLERRMAPTRRDCGRHPGFFEVDLPWPEGNGAGRMPDSPGWKLARYWRSLQLP